MSSLKSLFSTTSTTENKVTDEVDNDNGHLSPLPRVPWYPGCGCWECWVLYPAVIVILFGRQVAAAPRLISTPGSRPGQCCPQWSGSNIETLTSHKTSSYALNGWNITSNKPQISIGSGWARVSTQSWLLDSLLSPVKARSVAGCDHDLFHIWSVMDGLCSGSGPRSPHSS